MERDKLAVWQISSDLECEDLRLRRLGALSGRKIRKPDRGLEREKSGTLRVIIWKIWIVLMEVCTVVSIDTMASGELEAHDLLQMMDFFTEPRTADPQTDEQRRWNLLQEHEQQFEQLSDDQKLSKLFSNAGLKTVERGQYFITLDAEGPSGMVHLCREKTMLRNDPRTRAQGWIRRNTKIGPVLNIHVCHHEDRESIEIQVRSLFQDRTASCVRIVNGVEKYVNETTETIEDEEHGALGKPIAKARPRMKSTITLTPVSFPLRERKWVDVNPGAYDHKCYVVSKAMTWLLRLDQNIPRETDGAVRSSRMIGFLFWQKEEESRKGFNISLILTLPDTFRILEQSTDILEALLLILSCKTMYCFRTDSPSTSTTSGTPVKCIQQSEVDWSQEDKSLKRGRQSVVSTIVNPMEAFWKS